MAYSFSSSSPDVITNINAFVAAEDGADGSSHITPVAAVVATALSAAAGLGNGGRRYGRVPCDEIKNIIDAPEFRCPSLIYSPRKDKVVILKRGPLPTISHLAHTHKEKLAGLTVDAKSNYSISSVVSTDLIPFYAGISICYLLNDDGSGVRVNIPGSEKHISGLPEGSKITSVKWSPDEKHLCFALREKEVEGLKLWIADVKTGKATSLFNSEDIYLNAVFANFVWVNDSTLLVCTIPSNRGEEPPKKPLVPAGPKIESNELQTRIQARTYKNLLKDEYDEDLFDYYATSQLVLVKSLDGTFDKVGKEAIYTSLKPSPDTKYFLSTSIRRPYSFILPYLRFTETVELWRANGTHVRQIAHLPLAEDVPIANDNVRTGKRCVNWRADTPSSLYWVVAQDGGDANAVASIRDIIYTQHAEALEDEEPTVLYRLNLRYKEILWCNDSLALVKESWQSTRETKTWVISPGSNSPRLLFDRSSENAYSDPGSPMLRMSEFGTEIIAKVERPDDQSNYILLSGNGATDNGNIPFVHLFDIDTKVVKERIWHSDETNYYKCAVGLMSDQSVGELSIDALKIIITKESTFENPQHYLLCWPEKRPYQITNIPHPYPRLAFQKEIVRYVMSDGVQFTATLYTPAGYKSQTDGPLPCIVWAYPWEFKSRKAAGQVRGSPHKFADIRPTSPLLWLSKGFAVLDDPPIPIIGNDSFIQQLVDGAKSAVDKLVDMGVAERGRIAVGGHSYGAFMVANLLAHEPNLFSCGIARSGAYNRSLTPFGFQDEERNLWEAKDVYEKMSPFLYADQINKPILLVHGAQDSNSGTHTEQSERFYAALKANGVLCKLVILHFEDHNYVAWESIMHLAWETDEWLEKYCKNLPNGTNGGNVGGANDLSATSTVESVSLTTE